MISEVEWAEKDTIIPSWPLQQTGVKKRVFLGVTLTPTKEPTKNFFNWI